MLRKVIMHIENNVHAVAYHRSLVFPFLQMLDIANRRIAVPPSIIRVSSQRLPKYSGTVVNVQGNRMLLDAKDDLGLFAFGVYEPLVTETFTRIVRKNSVVLDVGANIGYYTLIAAKLVAEKGRVFAFEPEPANFSLLEENVRLNGYKNVVLERKAVSNKTGKADLFIQGKAGQHSICQPSTSHVQVETVNLDNYFRDFGKEIDLVKIDVEGAEPLVIQGMSELLTKNRRLKIIMEFNPLALMQAGFTSNELFRPLFEHGFRAYDLENKMTLLNLKESKLHTNLLWLR